MCCSQTLHDQDQCDCPNNMYPCAIVTPANPLVTRVSKRLRPEAPSITFDMNVNVSVTDLWNVRVVKCHTKAMEAVTVSGQINFTNPYGYLPGDNFYSLPVRST